MMTFVDAMIVSTKVNRGHFAASHSRKRQGVQATVSHGGGEAADRRGDVGAWRFGGARGASAWSEREPSVWLASALSARTAGAEGEPNAESAPGSCDGRDGKASSAMHPRG